MPVYVDPNGHLMGALGVAILSKSTPEIEFDFNIADVTFETKGIECIKCPNGCEIVQVYKSGDLIDAWGNKCDRGVCE